TCHSDSSGSGRDRERSDAEDAADDTVRLASAERTTDRHVAGSGAADCASASGCGTSSRVEVSEDGEVEADAETGCDTGCTGSARTSTDASVVEADAQTRRSVTAAHADCAVNGGPRERQSVGQ